MAKVPLTADRTLMSDHHHHEFVGFGVCAPPNVVLHNFTLQTIR